MGDPDEEVRDWAKESLEDCLATASAGDLGYLGFVTIAALDEPRFIERVGLTRPDAYDLYLSYAYAENGQYFDLGRAALAMVNDLAPPSSDGPASAI
ncbi:hypothetical protein Caci_7325 [Catenulispora acidiphila DSM 44928]|uniref:Uncharacterized protein n=2 Tax=Catenulispora TaxID=414878 RepID=C7Q8G6_CATAD|nr:hypothetical protein Caci_7325 [Catenulispora acidiphila DSM 44928]